MTCHSCGFAGPERGRFCPQCGVAYPARCASCGAELTPAARFCAACGAKADGAAASASTPGSRSAAQAGETRKVVTILFADLIGSTSLHERLDAESTRRLMERYYAALRGAADAHGGTIVKLMGDGVMVAFGVPQVAEDDAVRAVRAGFAMQQAFRVLADEQEAAMGRLGLRVGINTGEVVVSADNTDVVGDPVNVAARLQAEAGDGEVVIGESTRRLVASLVTLEPLGSFALKGRVASMNAYRVVSLERGASAATAAFVGRDDELARIGAVYEAALAKPAARLAVVLGSPGLGKSRLVAELARRLGDAASVVTAHCDAAGGATFAPIAEAIREFVGQGRLLNKKDKEGVSATIEAVLPPNDPECARIIAGISALLAGSSASPEETFFVIRRFLTALSQIKPVVLVIDDLHWAEPLLLDLVEHLIQWGSGVPLFVLVGARPELRSLRSSLATPGALVADVVTLAGLDAGAAMRLAASVIGASDLPAAVAAKVLATSEGNPLFVGELVRMLVDEGAIERRGDRWIVGANLAALEMPPTIHALLAARIERLRPEDRTVLELASVVGRNFSRSAVAALLSRNGSELDARLESLRRTELIERDAGWFLGEPVLRFHHVLIRDAAYRRLLKGTRAELHAQLAEWIEAQVGDAPEHDETIGRHLEQAHQHLSELGPLDERGRDIGDRASRRLAAAGRRALAGDDLPLAAGLLGRAIARLQADDAARAELALDWCEALLSAGDVNAATGAIDELARFAAGEGAERQRLRAWHACFTGQLAVLTEPQKLQPTADAVARAAGEFATLSDSAGEAKAHFVHALALARLGKVGACEASLDRALAAARRADDRRRANTVLALAPLAALWGPSPVTRASGRCLDVVRVLRITEGAPAVEAVALSCQGVLEALRGRTEAARRMIASARKMVEELGITQRLLETDVSTGLVELLEGDASAAERSLRGAYEGLRDLGLGIDAARAAALLARALLAQDRVAEAETLSHESEALAGDDLKAAIAWRGVRAEALAKRGEHGAAVELASKAVEMAATTDALLDHADARLALAAALRAAGRGGEADAEEHRATELWEAKGASLLAASARSDRRRAATVTAPASEPTVVAPAARRRVRQNAATAWAAQHQNAVDARDLDAIAANIRGDFQEIDHPTGSTWGRDAAVASLRRLFRSSDAYYQREHLATLGERLSLCWRRTGAGAAATSRYDVGPYENTAIQLIEVGECGRICRMYTFGADHLGDAIARLYERYAELLPEGPERARAAAIARSVAVWMGPPDPDRLATAISPSYSESIDHRSLGTWSAQGSEGFLGHWRWQQDLASSFAKRDDDILALEPDALLVRETYSGISRSSDGTFESVVLAVWVFGADGLLASSSAFEPDQEAEALARFDALAARAAREMSGGRRVRANAATRNIERASAAIAARDTDALRATLSEDLTVIHHPTGSTYGARGIVESWRDFFEARGVVARREMLATLGESLVLFRQAVENAGHDADGLSFGPMAAEFILLNEVDDHGQSVRSEVFASDHLCQATARLYERYAEILPEGRERARAAGVARAHSVWDGPLDTERVMSAFAPCYVCVDHRSLGTWSSEGWDETLRHWRGQADLAAGFSRRDDDILAFTPEANVTRQTYFGTSRVSGGYFENIMLTLTVLGVDGRYARCELFEPDREAEALARFDEIVAAEERVPARRRVRANAAVRSLERFDAALAARDAAVLEDLFDESLDVVHHPTVVTYGRREMLVTWRSLMNAERLGFRSETLASLGDVLALERHVLSFEGFREAHLADAGPSELEEISLIETDDRGRWQHVEIFAPDRLGDAMIRLYERHAGVLPEGPARTRAEGTARSVAAHGHSATNPERFAAGLAPEIVAVDHRTVGWGTLHGRDAVVTAVRVLLDLSDDVTWRFDEMLALSEQASLVRATQRGRAREGGGEWERPICWLRAHDGDGLIARWEVFETEQAAAALARFDALVTEPRAATPVRFANAATRTFERVAQSTAERDWQSLADLFAPSLRFDDRRPLLRMELSQKSFLEQHRVLFDVPNARWTTTPIATRGERLALSRLLFQGDVGGGGGALEIDHLVVLQVGDDGRSDVVVLFEPTDLDAAYAELDARFAELAPPAPSSDPFANSATASTAPVTRSMIAHDWEGFAQLFAEDFHMSDRRRVVQLELDRDRYVAFTREVADGRTIRNRWELVATRGDRLALTRAFFEFTDADIGPSEIAFLLLTEVNTRGRIVAYVRWDLEDLDSAYAELDACFDAGEGAAVYGAGFFVQHVVNRDWDAVAAMCAPSFVEHDHRPVVGLGTTRGAETWAQKNIRTYSDLVPGSAPRFEHVRVGARSTFFALTWRGTREGGDYEIPMVGVTEIDDQGRLTRLDVYAPEQLDEARARFVELG